MKRFLTFIDEVCVQYKLVLMHSQIKTTKKNKIKKIKNIYTTKNKKRKQILQSHYFCIWLKLNVLSRSCNEERIAIASWKFFKYCFKKLLFKHSTKYRYFDHLFYFYRFSEKGSSFIRRWVSCETENKIFKSIFFFFKWG